MKLLFVLPEYGNSFKRGIATFYNHLLTGLLQAGCVIDVCLPWEYDLPKDLKEHRQIRVFGVDHDAVSQAKKGLSQFAAFPNLQDKLAHAFAAFNVCDGGRKYDVVEATDFGLLFVPWLIRDTRPPVIVQLHSSYGQIESYDSHAGDSMAGLITRMLEASLLGRADELQSYGPTNAEEWNRLLNKEVSLIWPAWRPSIWSLSEDASAALPSEFDVADKGVVVGRIQNWKGPEVLCRALELLENRAPKIIWVGKDTNFRRQRTSTSAFLKQTYGNVWGKKILPIGEMSVELTARIQAGAKFVVVPSTWDTFNLTTIEAMWAGKVVICSEGAGASSLIRHAENGFRFPAGDPRKLASLLVEVDNMPSEARHEIGERARHTVAQELDSDRICALRIGRYRRLTECKTVARRRHPWIDSLFASDVLEPPFTFLETIPTRQLAKWTLYRVWSRIRNSIPSI
jgi:glycosyltransferase involved in cell wall biosynthesis